jgi:AmmeMemoRadiSam system protein A
MKTKEESVYVKLARETIENYIKKGKIINSPPGLPKEMVNQKAGVFVSLKKFGDLRGCIGTFMPTQGNIAQEIIKNAISAAVDDPRFSSVNVSELEDLSISVDVLSAPEEVKDISQLDPKKYGVIVSSGYKKGLLLPDLEGVDTVKYQIDIAKRKAGIYPGEKVKLYRFEVKRFH